MMLLNLVFMSTKLVKYLLKGYLSQLKFKQNSEFKGEIKC